MRGLVWLQEFSNGKDHGNYAQRFLILWPLSGIQCFSQEPLEIDPHKLKQIANGRDNGWICGGSIELKSLNTLPRVVFRELVLYPIELNLQHGDCVQTVQIALESKEACEEWANELSALMKSLIYAQTCLEFDQMPFLSLFENILQSSISGQLALRHLHCSYKMLQVISKLYLTFNHLFGQLSRLEMVNASLSDGHASLIASVLGKFSRSLLVINLSENFFSAKGIKIIASAIGQCPNLTSVDLSSNFIGDDCADELFRSLGRLRLLRLLNLAQNRFSKESAASLHRDLLNFRSQLTSIDLSYNMWGDGVGASVVSLLTNIPATLTSCDLSFCGISDFGIQEIAGVLSSCSTLKSFVADGVFLEPKTLRLIVSAVTQFHQRYGHQLSLKLGGIDQMDILKVCGLSAHALKHALVGLEECSLLNSISLKARLPTSLKCPVLCMRMSSPPFVKTADEIVHYLSQSLECNNCQLQVLSFKRSSSSTLSAFLVLAITPTIDDSLNNSQLLKRSDVSSIVQKVLELAQVSHPLLRMLGVRSVFAQYPRRFQNVSGEEETKGEEDLTTVQYAISGCGVGGRGAWDCYLPVGRSVDPYNTLTINGEIDDRASFMYDHWCVGAEQVNNDPKSSTEVSSRGADDGNDHSAEEEKNDTLTEIFARDLKLKENRQATEQLIAAVRSLHSEEEISTVHAKFWEGILGNRRFRAMAEFELLATMLEIESSSSYKRRVFPAVAQRLAFYDSMFTRDQERLQKLVATCSPVVGGQALVLGQRLLNEIATLQNTFLHIDSMVKKYADLRHVEDFLVQCGRLAYTGPEMFKAVEMRQEVVGLAVSYGEKITKADLSKIKTKALLTNLLISRDIDALKVKIEGLKQQEALLGEDYSNMPEYLLAQKVIQDYVQLRGQLVLAMQQRDLDLLDKVLSEAAFQYFVFDDIQAALEIFQDVAQNPAPIVKLIVQGMRENNMSAIKQGFDQLAKVGLYHAALETTLCVKIQSARTRIVQNETIKNKVVTIAMVLRNGLPVNSSEIAQVYRKALALGLDKDSSLHSYFAIIVKNTKKLTAIFKQEQYITDLLEENDIVRLNKLLSGRGGGRLVISFPSAFARDQWYDKLGDVCRGKYIQAQTEANIEETNLDKPANGTSSNIVYTGVFEKAARNAEGIYKGWRQRYFVLSGSHITYYTKAQGEKKGSMRVMGGAVRVMDPREFVSPRQSLAHGGDATLHTNRLYCLEIEEGRDISTISPDLLDDAQKRVRLAKATKLEHLLSQAVKYRSLVVLRKMLNYAKDLEMMVDYKIIRAAKQCLADLQEHSLKQEIHAATRLIPRDHVLRELVHSCQEYKLDPSYPSLIKINKLLKKSEIERELLRAAHYIRNDEIDGFISCFRKLAKVDWSQTQAEVQKLQYVNLFILFVSKIAHQQHLLGRSMLTRRFYRKALILSSAQHVETESMDLVRLFLHLNRNVNIHHALDILGNKEDSLTGQFNEMEERQISGQTDDIQSFVEEINGLPFSSSRHHAIVKYPKLRGVTENEKINGKRGFSFFGTKRDKKISRRRSAFVLEIMCYSPSPISKPLLLVENTANVATYVEAFVILNALMGERPFSSLARPGKSKIIKSPASPVTALADLLAAMNDTPGLVDECYFQLCKQLNGNEMAQSYSKGWLLFCIYLNFSLPSTSATPYLLFFVQEQLQRLIALNNDIEKEDEAWSGVEKDRREKVYAEDKQLVVENQKYALTAAKYASFLLNRSIERADSGSFITPPLSFSKLDVLPYLEVIMEQRLLDVEIVLMTGSVVKISLPFSQLSTPFSLLVRLCEILLPPEFIRYYRYKEEEMVIFDAEGRKLSEIDQQLVDDYDSLFNVDYFIDRYLQRKILGPNLDGQAVEDDLGKRTLSEEQWTALATNVFRDFGLFRLDPSACVTYEGNDQISVNLLSLPVQPMLDQLVDWQHDLQFEILHSFVLDNALDQRHKLHHLEQQGSRRFVLRNIVAAPKLEHFCGDYDWFGREFASFERNQRLQTMKDWLKTDSSNHVDRIPGHNDPSAAILPQDHLRLDLLFAEESRYVNSRLALLNDEHLHYLLAMQLAISWFHQSRNHDNCDGKIRLDNTTAGVAGCYMEDRLGPLRRWIEHFNLNRHRQITHLRNSLRKENAICSNDESGPSPDDIDNSSSDDGLDGDNPADLQRLQQKYEQIRAAQKYSPKPSLRAGRELFVSTSAQSIDNDLADEGFKDVKESYEEDELAELDGLHWEPSCISVNQPITTHDLEHLHQLLDALGVSHRSDDGGSSSLQIDLLWQYMAIFHTTARESGSSPQSAFYRYLIKRAYHDYLTGVTAYCGLHYREVRLVTLFLDVNLRHESPELTTYVDQFRGPLPVLLAVSSEGVYLCDATSWAVIFHSPLFDIQRVEIIDNKPLSTGRRSSNAVNDQHLLKLHINGLQIGLLCIAEEVWPILHILKICTQQAFASCDPELGKDHSMDNLITSLDLHKNSTRSMEEDEQHSLLQAFVLRYCPFLPSPPSFETFGLRLDASKSFRPLMNKRQVMLQMRLESLQRDEALSSLATVARYEKSQEQMNKQPRHSQDDDQEDDENDDEGNVKALRDSKSRTRKNKKRQIRSIFGDVHGSVTSVQQVQERMISSLTGVVNQQANKYISNLNSRQVRQSMHSSIYSTQGAIESKGNNLINLPIRVGGVIRTPATYLTTTHHNQEVAAKKVELRSSLHFPNQISAPYFTDLLDGGLTNNGEQSRPPDMQGVLQQLEEAYDNWVQRHRSSVATGTATKPNEELVQGQQDKHKAYIYGLST